jgi:hypothetical protein
MDMRSGQSLISALLGALLCSAIFGAWTPCRCGLAHAGERARPADASEAVIELLRAGRFNQVAKLFFVPDRYDEAGKANERGDIARSLTIIHRELGSFDTFRW